MNAHKSTGGQCKDKLVDGHSQMRHPRALGSPPKFTEMFPTLAAEAAASREHVSTPKWSQLSSCSGLKSSSEKCNLHFTQRRN